MANDTSAITLEPSAEKTSKGHAAPTTLGGGDTGVPSVEVVEDKSGGGENKERTTAGGAVE